MANLPLVTPFFDQKELFYLEKCLESGHVTQGPFVAQFEDLFAKYHNVYHAFAVTSCTTALHAALLALDIKEGDEVIVPSFTWLSTANVVEHVGAKPIFADVNLTDFCLDFRHVEKLINSATRAIIPVHLFGLMADMPDLLESAKANNIAVIEDAACATGSKYKNFFAGSMGDIGCFSFHPRKVITTGEGGMITTNSSMLADKICAIRNHGIGPQKKPVLPWEMPEVDTCGYNFRLSDIQGAVGLAQMEKIDKILAERKRIAEAYTERLKDCSSIKIPVEKENFSHTWQSYVVRILGGNRKRNQIMEKMLNKGIQTRPGTYAVHATDYYSQKYGLAQCSNSILCEKTTLALPVFHGMTDTELDIVSSFFE